MLMPEKVTLLLIAFDLAIQGKENTTPRQTYECLVRINNNTFLMRDENIERVVRESLEELVKVCSSTNVPLDSDYPLWKETQQQIYKNLVDVIVERAKQIDR